ncbi:DUF2490 domain-containing protein (plasmid) [Sphingomonas sp. AAP5]|uniref:DUF2490 domain-containing protein n=1 Tax=Sphingomonas sp. AAP5 TaxID=1523415 RepID=UPI0010573CCA|nr:DUF2490 domain-containing protein [Sphingomonas sp. AAP5]QBM77957.1 DUF2490 domain-containing protein [Sphingomonas sp. AAP5]
MAMSMVRHIALPLACLASAVIGSSAQAQDDTQAWGSVIATGPVRGDLFVWLEAQARATDDVGGGSQFIVRPAIGARIAPDAHAIAGYAYIRTDPEGGRTTNEHRLWQQVQFAAVRNGNGTPLIISRTRLEQRMLEGQDDTGWRLRQFVRLQVPIARQGTVQAVAFTEGFLNLNSTRWGARDGVDQWRTFVGIGVPVAPRMRLEPGYLNQHIFRRGEDRANHVLSATLFVGL